MKENQKVNFVALKKVLPPNAANHFHRWGILQNSLPEVVLGCHGVRESGAKMLSLAEILKRVLNSLRWVDLQEKRDMECSLSFLEQSFFFFSQNTSEAVWSVLVIHIFEMEVRKPDLFIFFPLPFFANASNRVILESRPPVIFRRDRFIKGGMERTSYLLLFKFLHFSLNLPIVPI